MRNRFFSLNLEPYISRHNLSRSDWFLLWLLFEEENESASQARLRQNVNKYKTERLISTKKTSIFLDSLYLKLWTVSRRDLNTQFVTLWHWYSTKSLPSHILLHTAGSKRKTDLSNQRRIMETSSEPGRESDGDRSRTEHQNHNHVKLVCLPECWRSHKLPSTSNRPSHVGLWSHLISS